MDYITNVFSHPPRDTDRPIFVDAEHPQRTINWKQYKTYVQRVSVGLKQNGLAERDCVGVLSKNDIYLSVLGDAIIAAGAIFSGLPAFAKQDGLIHLCAAAQIKWLVVAPEYLDLTLAITKQSGISDQNVVLFDPPDLPHDGNSTHKTTTLAFSHLLEAYDEGRFTNTNVGKDLSKHIAARLFTSGTTGPSKAAEFSHASLVTRMHASSTLLVGDNVRYLHFVGMSHIGGLLFRMKAVAGYMRMYVSKAASATEIVDRIREHRIQHTLLPPRTLAALREVLLSGTRTTEDIESIKMVTVGGSNVPNEALDAFQSLLGSEAKINVMYGSTEIGVASAGYWRPGTHSVGYVGQVAPQVRVKVVDPDTLQDCGSHDSGEILSFGPEMFSGYCNNAEATHNAFVTDLQGERWFRTGDKGRLTSDQSLLMIGRYKELFKVGSEEVAPSEVEFALLKHPLVEDAAAMPAQDRNDPQSHEVQAYVVADRSEGAIGAQELVNHVAEVLSPRKAPTGGVTFCASIPRTPMRKVIAGQLHAVEALPGSQTYLDVK